MTIRDVKAGQRVREIATNREGVVEYIGYDNSCGDPDCCGGPYPDLLHVRFDDAQTNCPEDCGCRTRCEVSDYNGYQDGFPEFEFASQNSPSK